MENLAQTMENEDKSRNETFKTMASIPHMSAAVTE